MKQPNSIDYTTKRKGTKLEGSVIDYCPKCGRKGLRVEYLDGMVIFEHQKRFSGFAWEITDSHIIPSQLSLKEAKARDRLYGIKRLQFFRQGLKWPHREAWLFCKNQPVEVIYTEMGQGGYSWDDKSWRKQR